MALLFLSSDIQAQSVLRPAYAGVWCSAAPAAYVRSACLCKQPSSVGWPRSFCHLSLPFHQRIFTMLPQAASLSRRGVYVYRQATA